MRQQATLENYRNGLAIQPPAARLNVQEQLKVKRLLLSIVAFAFIGGFLMAESCQAGIFQRWAYRQGVRQAVRDKARSKDPGELGRPSARREALQERRERRSRRPARVCRKGGCS